MFVVNKFYYDGKKVLMKKKFKSLEEATEYVKNNYDDKVEMYAVGIDGKSVRYIYKDEETGEIIY